MYSRAQGVIAPHVLQPVTGILVSLGDKVKKGQPLVQLRETVVSAPLDGVVNRLEVHPGMVSTPGTVWGEILDITVIEVVVHLTPGQSDLFKIGGEADVLRADSNQSYGNGQIVFIDQKANSETGKIVARVHLANFEGRLRCGAAVQVRIPQSREISGIKGKISNEEHKP